MEDKMSANANGTEQKGSTARGCLKLVIYPLFIFLVFWVVGTTINNLNRVENRDLGDAIRLTFGDTTQIAEEGAREGEDCVYSENGTEFTIPRGDEITATQDGNEVTIAADEDCNLTVTMVVTEEGAREGEDCVYSENGTEFTIPRGDEITATQDGNEVTIAADEDCNLTVTIDVDGDDVRDQDPITPNDTCNTSLEYAMFEWVDGSRWGDRSQHNVLLVENGAGNMLIVVNEAGEAQITIDSMRMQGLYNLMTEDLSEVACVANALSERNPEASKVWIGDHAPAGWSSTLPRGGQWSVTLDPFEGTSVDTSDVRWSEAIPFAVGEEIPTAQQRGAYMVIQMNQGESSLTHQILVSIDTNLVCEGSWQGTAWQATPTSEEGHDQLMERVVQMSEEIGAVGLHFYGAGTELDEFDNEVVDGCRIVRRLR
jgi:hypothetical protein